MVQMLYVACQDGATPVVEGMDVGRWVADDPIIALTNPTGLCVVWHGLDTLWDSVMPSCSAAYGGGNHEHGHGPESHFC